VRQIHFALRTKKKQKKTAMTEEQKIQQLIQACRMKTVFWVFNDSNVVIFLNRGVASGKLRPGSDKYSVSDIDLVSCGGFVWTDGADVARMEKLFEDMRKHDIPALEPNSFQLFLLLFNAGVRIVEVEEVVQL
jgi:hypothetical protein